MVMEGVMWGGGRGKGEEGFSNWARVFFFISCGNAEGVGGVVVWCIIRSRTGWKNFRSDWCARCSWL